MAHLLCVPLASAPHMSTMGHNRLSSEPILAVNRYSFLKNYQIPTKTLLISRVARWVAHLEDRLVDNCFLSGGEEPSVDDCRWGDF
jgi:hypothetical protein